MLMTKGIDTMGSLNISGLAEIELDDDLLAHIQAVIVAKLRRKEPVLLSWVDCEDHARQIWIQASAIVLAEYDGPQPARLDRDWLERIMIAANSTTGISLHTADLERHTHTIPVQPTALPRLHEAGPAATAAR